MNSKDFLLQELNKLAKKFPGVSFRYDHNSAFKEHVIEVSPESTYKSNELYGDAEYKISRIMMELFPMETVAFVGADSLIKINNVTEIIAAVSINWFSSILQNNNSNDFLTLGCTNKTKNYSEQNTYALAA